MVRQVATIAKLRSAAALLTVVGLASCGLFHRSAHVTVAANVPRTWVLVDAPFTREFPGGDLQAPLSSWTQVRSFDTAAACDAILEQAEDNLQRPVQCVASDDPRLKPAPGGSDSKP